MTIILFDQQIVQINTASCENMIIAVKSWGIESCTSNVKYMYIIELKNSIQLKLSEYLLIMLNFFTDWTTHEL